MCRCECVCVSVGGEGIKSQLLIRRGTSWPQTLQWEIVQLCTGPIGFVRLLAKKLLRAGSQTHTHIHTHTHTHMIHIHTTLPHHVLSDGKSRLPLFTRHSWPLLGCLWIWAGAWMSHMILLHQHSDECHSIITITTTKSVQCNVFVQSTVCSYRLIVIIAWSGTAVKKKPFQNGKSSDRRDAKWLGQLITSSDEKTPEHSLSAVHTHTHTHTFTHVSHG